MANSAINEGVQWASNTDHPAGNSPSLIDALWNAVNRPIKGGGKDGIPEVCWCRICWGGSCRTGWLILLGGGDTDHPAGNSPSLIDALWNAVNRPIKGGGKDGIPEVQCNSMQRLSLLCMRLMLDSEQDSVASQSSL